VVQHLTEAEPNTRLHGHVKDSKELVHVDHSTCSFSTHVLQYIESPLAIALHS
jgi:hypothetical protein